MTIRHITIAAALVAAMAPGAAAQRATPPPVPAPAPALSEAQRLKASVLAAQMEAVETSIALGQAKLELLKRSAQDLAAEYLATVQAPPGSTWDWSRMVAVPPAEKSAPAKNP